MLIQWCLKGVPFVAGHFDDAQVASILSGDGITSAWLRNAGAAPIPDIPRLSQDELSAVALNDHVHAYGSVSASTPYIDRKSTRLNSSHRMPSRMPSSA